MLKDAQQSVDDWIRQFGVRYFDPLTNLAQLTEEVGEVARILSRTHGQQSIKPGASLGSLGDELADVLFVVICLANQHDIDLGKAFAANLDKKTHRDSTRHRDNPKLDNGGDDAGDNVDHDAGDNASGSSTEPKP